MTGRIATLEKSQEPRVATQVLPLSNSVTRWANHMDGRDVPMFTEPQYEDLDDEDDKNNNQGTKLFTVSKDTEEL